MSGKNQGSSVAKANPEEQAIIANLGALVQQLQGLGAADINGPAAEPDGDEGLTAPGVQKGSEQGRQEGADNVSQPGAADPKEKGMAPWGDDVKKALQTIAKALQTSDTDGPTANDDAEKHLKVNQGPDNEDMDNLPVVKALAALLSRKPVAKSMGSAQQSPAGMHEMLTVMKGMADRLESQQATIDGLLEGLGIANTVPAPDTSVQKNQGNRPAAGAGMYGAELVDVIAMSVAKAMQQGGGQFRQSESGLPVAKGFEQSRNGDDIRQFTEQFAGMSGWGIRPSNQ